MSQCMLQGAGRECSKRALKMNAYGDRLQEQYLSRRTLVFIKDKIYFRCRKRIWSEETCADQDPVAEKDEEEWNTNLVMMLQQDMDRGKDPWTIREYFVEVASRFMMRNLTFENDAIDAMSGILHRISVIGQTPILHGVPERWLPEIMAFTPRQLRRRKGFPSWSWAGWLGEMLFRGDEGECQSQIYTISRTRGMRRVWAPDGKAWKHLDVSAHDLNPDILALLAYRPYSLLRLNALMLLARIDYSSDFEDVFQEGWPAPVWLTTQGGMKVGLLTLDMGNKEELHGTDMHFIVIRRRVHAENVYHKAWLTQHKTPESRLGTFAYILGIIEVGPNLYERRGFGVASEDYLSWHTVKHEKTIYLA
jgi:hypothetical protein